MDYDKIRSEVYIERLLDENFVSTGDDADFVLTAKVTQALRRRADREGKFEELCHTEYVWGWPLNKQVTRNLISRTLGVVSIPADASNDSRYPGVKWVVPTDPKFDLSDCRRT